MNSRSIGSQTSKLVAALIAAMWILSAGAAHASKKRVVVMQFRGPKSRAIRKGVVKLLKRKFKLVGQTTFTRKQRKLHARRINERNVAKVARALRVHAVVLGRIKRRRGRYSLSLTLRAGIDGEVVTKVTVKLGRRPRLTRPKLRKIRQSLVGAIAGLPTPPRKAPAPAPAPADDEETWSSEADGDTSDVDDNPLTDDQVDNDEPGARPLADADHEDDSTVEPAGDVYDRLARHRALDIAGGLSAISRSLSFDVGDGVADPPNAYDGALVPGAFVEGTIYPAAWGHGKAHASALANLGVSFMVDKVLSISSRLNGSDVDISTSQLRWGFGLRYRLNLGDDPQGASFTFGIGYNELSFELDRKTITDNMLDIDLPNVAYGYIDPSVAGRLPINRAIAAYATARYLIVTSVGDIEGDAAYGPASASGLDVDAGVEYRIDAHLLVRGGIRLQRLSLSFDGTGALSDRNGDGTTDVTGATDQFWGGYATVGYIL